MSKEREGSMMDGQLADDKIMLLKRGRKIEAGADDEMTRGRKGLNLCRNGWMVVSYMYIPT
jgi:hypothetical protein